MAELLKHIYNESFISKLSKSIKRVDNKFKPVQFKKDVLNNEWQYFELKQRMQHISRVLRVHLPKDYKSALDILMSLEVKDNGFEYMFLPDFVEQFGLQYFDESISALTHFTKSSSAEFAVRPFIMHYENKMMKQMHIWAESDNYHERRLASEGCRPRLPWAMALPKFKKNPKPILPILEKLKTDGEEYVRRSVANNLNDIAKDNPETVIKIAKHWSGLSSDTDKLIKHACRTLLKSGEPQVLSLFGFKNPSNIQLRKFKLSKSVVFDGMVEFEFSLFTTKKNLGKLRLEYAIDFLRNNNQHNRKVFKIAEADYAETEKKVKKSYSFKPITTRKYYPGKHYIGIIVNGVEFARKPFMLNS